MEELFTLGLCSENKSFLSNFAKNRLYDRHLIPLIFSYIFPQECKKSCLCRHILDDAHRKTKKTLEKIPKIVRDDEFKNYVRAVITRKFTKKQETFSTEFSFSEHDIFRHVKIVEMQNCSIEICNFSLKFSEIKFSEIKNSQRKIIDFFPKFLCGYYGLNFVVVPIDSKMPAKVVMNYDIIDLNENVKRVFAAWFATFFAINGIGMVCQNDVAAVLNETGFSYFKQKFLTPPKLFDRPFIENFPMPEVAINPK